MVSNRLEVMFQSIVSVCLIKRMCNNYACALGYTGSVTFGNYISNCTDSMSISGASSDIAPGIQPCPPHPFNDYKSLAVCLDGTRTDRRINPLIPISPDIVSVTVSRFFLICPPECVEKSLFIKLVEELRSLL